MGSKSRADAVRQPSARLSLVVTAVVGGQTAATSSDASRTHAGHTTGQPLADGRVQGCGTATTRCRTARSARSCRRSGSPREVRHFAAKAAPPSNVRTFEDPAQSTSELAPSDHKAEIFATSVRTEGAHTLSDLRKRADSPVSAERRAVRTAHPSWTSTFRWVEAPCMSSTPSVRRTRSASLLSDADSVPVKPGSSATGEVAISASCPSAVITPPHDCR